MRGELRFLPNRPKTYARNPPLNPTIPHKVTNVSICDKRSEPRTGGCGGSDPMIEAGVPSTGGWVVPAPPGVVMVSPPEVRCNAEGAPKRRPRPRGVTRSAAKGIIEAGAPAFGCTVHPLRLQAPRAAYAHKSPGHGDCTATPGWPGGRDGRKSIKSKIIDTKAADSAIVGNMPYLRWRASPAKNVSNERDAPGRLTNARRIEEHQYDEDQKD